MIPHGAIITTWHLATLLFFAPRHWLKSLTLVSILIGATLPYGVAAAALKYERSGIPAYISEHATYCGTEHDKPALPEKSLILRLDDVQSHAWRNVAVEMIDEAIKRELLISIGLIPHKLETDQELVQMLRARHCYLDVTLHGYLHLEDAPEFLPLDYQESTRRMELGLTQLKMITSESINIFIPPGNKISEAARKAALNLGMHTSSEGATPLDYDVSTYDFQARHINESADVILGCQNAWQTEGKCIVMLHPQDYATNGQKDDLKYARYTQLLDELISKGANTSTLTALANNNNQVSVD